MTIRFDDAADRVARAVRGFIHEHARPCTVIRDLRGVLRVVVDDRMGAVARDKVEALDVHLREAAGPFAPPDASVFLATEFGDPSALTEGSRTLEGGVGWIERTVLAWDWSPERLPPFSERPQRLVFYGIKGGVGRSTATAVTAFDLARRGKRVLVIDLDLESPGVGEMLAPRGPSYGVVDWLVEDLVHNADEALVRAMLHRVSIAEPDAGDLWVAPTHAQPPEGTRDSYMQKLARAYQAANRGSVARPFVQRVHEVVTALERETKADVTLIDSRAGLHEIGAATLVNLGGTCLLFAMNSPQTWVGYRLLFEAWAERDAALRELRQNVQLVAALVPEAGGEAYVAALRDRAYDLFVEHLYDAQGSATDDVFNHELNDLDAPHTPLEIHWNRKLLEFSPTTATWPPEVRAAYEPFLDGLYRRKLVP